MLYVYLYSISLTCIKFSFNGLICDKEAEIISNLGSFKTISECETAREYFINNFEYAKPTRRANLFCKDTRDLRKNLYENK